MLRVALVLLGCWVAAAVLLFGGLALFGWLTRTPPAPDVALTQAKVRAVRMKGGWGALPPSARDVRLFVYDPGGDGETQFLKFRLKTSEADALASRLLAGGRPVGQGGCLSTMASDMVWWPKGCPEGAEEGQHDNLDRGFARVIQRDEGEMSTMWLALGAGWH
ncbi:hypothetical protein FHS96_000149 [Sphingomonas zeicaulis]|uniref:hypothetical protein n=1 Tax=Sphingomonas zeicaulis TaxID=1632740 RepID=UPI003D239EB2